MNKYKLKRIKARLSEYTVAKELGISLKQYKEIEKGKISLEGELLDKFNNIINNSKSILFNRTIKIQAIKNLQPNQRENLLTETNKNKMTICRELEISAYELEQYINHCDKLGLDLLEQIYDYCMNPLNKLNEKDDGQIEKQADIEEWYESITKNKGKKFKELMIKFNYRTQLELSERIGYTNSTISCYVCSRPEQATKEFKETLYNFFNDKSNKKDKMSIQPYSHKFTGEVVGVTSEGRKIRTDALPLTKEEVTIIENFKQEKGWTTAILAKNIGIPMSSLTHYIAGRGIKNSKRKMIFDYIKKNSNTNEEQIELDFVEPVEYKDITFTQEEVNGDITITEPKEVEYIENVIENIEENKTNNYLEENIIEIMKENTLLKQENQELKKQLTRYEKLIDRI